MGIWVSRNANPIPYTQRDGYHKCGALMRCLRVIDLALFQRCSFSSKAKFIIAWSVIAVRHRSLNTLSRGGDSRGASNRSVLGSFLGGGSDSLLSRLGLLDGLGLLGSGGLLLDLGRLGGGLSRLVLSLVGGLLSSLALALESG